MNKKKNIHNQFFSQISQTTNQNKCFMTDINKSSSLTKIKKYISELKQNPMPPKRNSIISPRKKPVLNDETFTNYVSLPTITSSTNTGKILNARIFLLFSINKKQVQVQQ